MNIKNLSLTTQKQYNLLSDEAKYDVKKEFRKNSKSIFVAYVCWIMVGMHYAYVGKWSTNIVYWVTGGGFFIWMFIDIFRIPGIVGEYNDNILEDIVLKLKILERD
jgi:TM2 domain-containing membrane protein YozV